jgi:CBS domain-containing protein
MKTLELMRTHITRTTPNATLGEAVDLMDIYRLSELPVVDDAGVLCGVLTEGDVLRALRSQTGECSLEALRNRRDLCNALVGNYMSVPPVSVRETEEAAVGVERMLEAGYKFLPVITAEGKVIGTLTRIDAIQAIFEENL